MAEFNKLRNEQICRLALYGVNTYEIAQLFSLSYNTASDIIERGEGTIASLKKYRIDTIKRMSLEGASIQDIVMAVYTIDLP